MRTACLLDNAKRTRAMQNFGRIIEKARRSSLMTGSCPNDNLIGRRIREPNGMARGTIEFVGEVDGQTGIWYGVNWDDDTKGKHDGMLKGRRYFSARYIPPGSPNFLISSSPTSGSFLRASRLPSSSLGTTVVSASHDRYTVNVDAIAYDPCAFGSKRVEIVGMHKIANKQKDVSTLIEVALDGSSVDICGNADELRSSLAACTSLDLSNSLVDDAAQLVGIARTLPNVSTINASQLHLRDVTLDVRAPCTSLTMLQLNHCALDWPQVDRLLRSLPNIASLGLCGNRITSIATDIPPSIAVLDLEANPIASFADVERLGMADRLTSLNLSRCEIETVALSFEGPSFVALRELFLRECPIASYKAVNTLAHRAPVLRHLVIARTPLLASGDVAAVRQMVIARMRDTLEFLDRQIITADERRGAQIDYIRAYAQEYNRVKDDVDSFKVFLGEHPNYDTLLLEYGAASSADIAAATATGALSERMITINVCAKLAGGDQIFAKTVPRTLPISRLREMIGRHCHQASTNLRLHMEMTAEDGSTYRFRLDNHSRTLEFYSLKTDDTIVGNFHLYKVKK